MLSNPMNSWYTDLANVYRNKDTVVNGINKQERVLVRQRMPCRVYRSSNDYVNQTTTYASTTSRNMMACSVVEDIERGDEIWIHRGARITQTGNINIYIAGDPNDLFEPYGGARPRIDHKETPLGGERKINEGEAEAAITDGLWTRNSTTHGRAATTWR